MLNTMDLLNNTFNYSFNEDNYQKFLTELLNTPIDTYDDISHLITKTFKDYISSIHEYETYIDKDDNELALYSICLKKNKSIDKARTMQRNIVAKLLKDEVLNDALVAFYNDEEEDWRFSYVNIDYELSNNKIYEKLSSAKRHSFLVGKNEPNHTCQKQFKPILENLDDIVVTDIVDAFQVENVTELFYDEYKNLYIDLTESINEILKKDELVKLEFENRNIDSSDFAKRTLGQLVFLYFLQKKGWLGVTKNGKWGDGSKNFMKKLFNKEYIEYKNFYNDVLEPLFYEGLSEKSENFHYNDFNCKLPFLNGGLFENMNGYDWKNTDLIIDNSIFKHIIDTFNTYNFTVKEDDPLDKEVAIDPEMLGKVFERLLEVKDRKDSGSFYTPRYIVHSMCQQSLISYLESNTPDIPREDLEEFIVRGHLALDSILNVQLIENESIPQDLLNEINLPSTIIFNSDELTKLLKEVKIVDPAVGSGAFPVAMMNEIANARQILNLITGLESNMYELKKETIENSIYGVDISFSAVTISKLRFWLSLIVDEENYENIESLPNLDNHIMNGDSLVDEYENIKLFDETLDSRGIGQKTIDLYFSNQVIKLTELESKKKKYFTANSEEKREIKKEINKMKWDFIEESIKETSTKNTAEILDNLQQFKNEYKTKPFFLWNLEFSEIFKGENPGFDIVIGNPPYVRQEKIKELKPYLKEHYDTYTGVADLYVYFFEKGIKLLKKGGCLTYITSNKYTRAKYGLKLRKYLKKQTIDKYLDFTGEKIFKNAEVDTSIIELRKKEPELHHPIKTLEDYDFLQDMLEDNVWAIEPPEIIELKNKILSKGTPIKNIPDIKIYRGILTGYNKAFIIDEETKNQLIKEDSKNSEIIKPILRGRDIKKWHMNYQNLYLLYIPWQFKISEFHSIKKYLSQFKENLSKRPEVKNKKYPWYALSRYASDYYQEMDKNKLVYPETSSNKLFAIFDDQKYYIDKTTFMLISNKINLKVIAVLLSSNIFNFIYLMLGGLLGKDAVQLSKIYIEQLPLPNINNDKSKILICFYDKLIELNKNGKKEEISHFEKKLNNYIYKNIYCLSDDEIKTIEKKLKVIN